MDLVFASLSHTQHVAVVCVQLLRDLWGAGNYYACSVHLSAVVRVAVHCKESFAWQRKPSVARTSQDLQTCRHGIGAAMRLALHQASWVPTAILKIISCNS
jgi:hypothetical protein